MKTTSSAREPAHGAEAPRRGSITVAGTLALALVALGGLNWGLVGLADLDLVAALFGERSIAARAIYVLIAVAAVYCLIRLPRWSRAG